MFITILQIQTAKVNSCLYPKPRLISSLHSLRSIVKLRADQPKGEIDRMKIIAHRCGTDQYPELTINSARNSLRLGASYVELDTRFTRDGGLVVNHDDSGAFLFGCPTRIADLSMADFLQLRYKDDPAYPACRLEDFFLAGIRQFLFHVKEGGRAKIGAIYDLCQKYNAVNSVVFGLQSAADIEVMKTLDPAVKILAFMPDPRHIEGFAAAGADYIRLWEDWASEESFREVFRTGRKVWIMAGTYATVGYTEPANLNLWAQMGADAVLVNEVSAALNQLQQSGPASGLF